MPALYAAGDAGLELGDRDRPGRRSRRCGALARAGIDDLVFVARGAQLDAVRAAGLRVETPRGAFTVRPPVVGRVDEVAWRATSPCSR